MRVQTIERGGTWWAQAPDGRWARWSDIFGEWEPIEGLPPGMGPQPPEAEVWHPSQARPIEVTPAPATPDAQEEQAGMVRDYLGTLFRLSLPALLLGLALPLLFLFSLMFLVSRGALPPPDNVKAILVFSLVAGVFLGGAIAVPPYVRHHRFGGAARMGIAAVLVTVGLPLAWLATGTQWSGSTASKGATLLVVLLLGIGIEALYRLGAFSWLQSGRRAASPFTGPA